MKMRLKFVIALALLAFYTGTSSALALPVGFTEIDPPQEYFIEVNRVISMAPNITEMIFFLGYGDKLVGRTDFCNYPPEALELPTVGGFVDTSLEKIVSLNPDLVIAYQGNSLELLDQLRHLRVPILVFEEAKTLDEIGGQMSDLVWALEGGAGIGGTWNDELQELKQTTPSAPPPTMMFGYPGETTFTCGPDTFVADLIRSAGAINITDSIDGNWVSVSAEFVLTANPDWILTATSCTGDDTVEDKRAQLLSELGNDPVWSALKAVKQNQVIVLDSDVLLRPGPRILEALRAVRDAINSAGEHE